MKPNAQLRRHLPSAFLSKLVYFFHTLRKVKLGNRVVVYVTAKLSRYPENITIGHDVVIKGGAHICVCNEGAKIEIGDRTTIGFHTFIYSSQKIIIGSDCMVAPFVYIVDSNHSTKRSELMNRQNNVTSPVIIGDDVWLGANSTILSGVRIKKGAIIAAGSIVNRDVEAYEIYAGSPAEKIGERK